PSKPCRWACVVKKQGAPAWIPITGDGPDGAWTIDDQERPGALRAALIGNDPGWSKLATELARQRLTPLRPHLEGVKRLIVLPSPALAGVPLETLVAALPDGTPRPLVSYAPSGTMFARLTKPRASDAAAKQLLALGDPAYRAATPNVT